MENFRVVRKLLNYATENESKKCYGEAIKSQREAVHLMQHLVNNVVTSKTVQNELMLQVIKTIQRVYDLENIIVQNEERRKYKEIHQSKPQKDLNVEESLKNYFESKQGQKHTEEQKKSLENISKIVNISKPKINFNDIYGMEGNIVYRL